MSADIAAPRLLAYFFEASSMRVRLAAGGGVRRSR
ncbi:MAG: hypothetical protein QOD59_5077 [Mycobacterium sp.]|nr:hypothetical protein [Mycobacterium sp.]